MSFSLSDPSLGVIVVPGMFMVCAEAPGGGGWNRHKVVVVRARLLTDRQTGE